VIRLVIGYIVYNYCFWFDRGVIHVVVFGYIVYNYCLRFDRREIHVVLVGYIVYNYCLMLTEEKFMLFWLVILSTITV